MKLKTNLSLRRPAALAALTGLLLMTALISGCSSGQWVDSDEEFITENMDQVCLQWKRSSLYEGPVCIKEKALWDSVQNKIGRQLGEVNFNANMVVGHFAIEPDTPAMLSGTGKAEDRGYGVKIKSIRKRGSDGLAVRLKVVTTTRLDDAEGPLHYALAVVPRHDGDVVFYVNGVKYEYSSNASFVKKNPQSFMDQVRGVDPDKK